MGGSPGFGGLCHARIHADVCRLCSALLRFSTSSGHAWLLGRSLTQYVVRNLASWLCWLAPLLYPPTSCQRSGVSTRFTPCSCLLGALGFHGGWSGVEQGALKADCVQIWWPLAPPLHPSPTASHPAVPRAGGQGAASHGPRHHAHGRVCVHHLWQAVPPHRGPAQDPEPRLGRKVSIRDHGR